MPKIVFIGDTSCGKSQLIRGLAGVSNSGASSKLEIHFIGELQFIEIPSGSISDANMPYITSADALAFVHDLSNPDSLMTLNPLIEKISAAFKSQGVRTPCFFLFSSKLDQFKQPLNGVSKGDFLTSNYYDKFSVLLEDKFKSSPISLEYFTSEYSQTTTTIVHYILSGIHINTEKFTRYDHSTISNFGDLHLRLKALIDKPREVVATPKLPLAPKQNETPSGFFPASPVATRPHEQSALLTVKADDAEDKGCCTVC